MSAYLWIIIATVAGPFALSFDKKVAFYKQFKYLFPAILIIGFAFISWDIYFTANSIWGFTPEYLSGIYFYNLPIEECLFFLVVPFACVFIHEVLKAYFPKFQGKKLAHFFAFAFTFSGLLFGVMNFDNWYTSSACIISAILTIGIYFRFRVSWYQNFVFTYLVALIPFIIVNGILTGAVTDKPIVWYSEEHIIGLRIITIPFEDLYYNYCMLLPIVGIFEYLKSRKERLKKI
jgi:lycopene cyclase domain-containing protein